MNDQSDEQMDQLLRQWSHSHAASPDHLEELRHKLADTIATSEKPNVDRATTSRAQQILIGFAGIAALLVIAFGLRPWKKNDDSRLAVLNPNRFALMSNSDLAAKGKLLAELQRLFDKRLGWLVEHADDVQMDVQIEQDSPSSRFLAFRLALVSRQSADADWQLAWSMDVLSRDQRVLNIEQIPDGRDELSVWTFLLPDGRVAVDMDANIASAGKLSTNGSTVLEPGIPGKVIAARRNGIDYRIYQTVAVVDEGTI